MEHTCKMKTTPRKGLPCGHYIKPDDGHAGFCSLSMKFRCEEALKKYLPALSYSSLTSFIQCRERFHKHSILGIRSYLHTLPDAMKAGAMWDRWLVDQWDRWLVDQNEWEQAADRDTYQPSDVLLAKLDALIRAYADLEIEGSCDESQEPSVTFQEKVSFPLGDNLITGYVDRAYGDHIVEVKLSSRPEFQTHIEVIQHQVGTYLMANEEWEWVDMEITRLPDLKTGKRQYSDESMDAYQERCYQDILSRPSHYFLGWDRKTHTYGKRFWRSEFDLKKLWKVYRDVFRDLRRAIDEEAWWQNTLSCHVPTTCLYHPICKTGVVSEELYYYSRPKKGDK